MRYQKKHTVDLGEVLGKEYAGVTLSIELAKARVAARWMSLFQRIQLVNQRALKEAKDELGAETFLEVFGEPDAGKPQVHGDAAEPIAEYAEAVLSATVVSAEGVDAADTDIVEAVLGIGLGEALMVAQHVQGLHVTTRRENLS